MSYTQYWTQTDLMDYMGCNDQMNIVDILEEGDEMLYVDATERLELGNEMEDLGLSNLDF